MPYISIRNNKMKISHKSNLETQLTSLKLIRTQTRSLNKPIKGLEKTLYRIAFLNLASQILAWILKYWWISLLKNGRKRRTFNFLEQAWLTRVAQQIEIWIDLVSQWVKPLTSIKSIQLDKSLYRLISLKPMIRAQNFHLLRELIYLKTNKVRVQGLICIKEVNKAWLRIRPRLIKK